jgi:hypothetical protein
MSDYPAIPAQQWNVTDQQVMSLLQLATLEPDDAGATWPSGMWSQAQVLQFLNDILGDFMNRTGIVSAIGFIVGVPNQGAYDLPQDMVDLRRIAWRPGPGGTGYVELYATDTFQQDQNENDWPANAQQVPTAYLLNLLASLTVRVTPIPNDIGEAEITTTPLGAIADGSGVALSVPDDWTPYIAWGVLGEMFGKEGEASDPERAEYCRSRYEEGVELARFMVQGVAYA